MSTQHGVKYKGYRLNCEPMLLTDGRYGAQIIISSATGDAMLERALPSLDEFGTEEEAFEHSKQYGQRWVDDHQ